MSGKKRYEIKNPGNFRLPDDAGRPDNIALYRRRVQLPWWKRLLGRRA